MNADTGYPETLMEAVKYFSTGDNAFNFMVALRWGNNGVTCPTCGGTNILFIGSRKVWECREKHERRQFSVKVGTIFEDSPVKLEKWFCAMWMVANCKNGVSSYEIHREIGVTQKTGWFMLHRIRLAMEMGTIMKGSGVVEADETFVGGKAEFMHKDVKERRGIRQGDGMQSKTAVVAVLDRHTKSHSTIVAHEVLRKMPSKKAVMKLIAESVHDGSEVFTDQSAIYEDLQKAYEHEVINHAERYVRENVIHTNGLENFWSLLKRALKGTYVSVEPCHLFRYVTEQVFRFNARKDDNHGRFLDVVANVVGKRITYKQLIGAFGTEGGDCLPA